MHCPFQFRFLVSGSRGICPLRAPTLLHCGGIISHGYVLIFQVPIHVSSLSIVDREFRIGGDEPVQLRQSIVITTHASQYSCVIRIGLGRSRIECQSLLDLGQCLIKSAQILQKKRIPMARKGECFEVTFQRKETASDRDGVFYLFHLRDLTDKQRGVRLVSVFRFGPKEFYSPNYDAQLDMVLLNTIRRAFDAGVLSFNAAYDEHTYKEISLHADEFKAQKVASGDEIQQLIKHEAYWLAFRHNPNPGYPVDFDSPTDLEYLGATPAEVRRYVLLLGQRGLLEKIMEGLGRPTAKLIDSYEAQLQQKIPQPSQTHESWDVFISHASEDKDAIARPLAEALRGKGLRVWYDEFSLTVGDSLRKSIDYGLAHSRFGAVILSKHFFEKHWPEQELNGLATREVEGKKVILPVWHGVSFNDVRENSPMLADRVAVSTDKGLEKVVEQLLLAMK